MANFIVQMQDGSKLRIEANEVTAVDDVLTLRDANGRGVAVFGRCLWLTALLEAGPVEVE